MPANLKNSAVATGLEMVSLHPIPKIGNARECSNYHTIALISHVSKVMLKILQARLQKYVNCELPDVKARFRKGRGTRDHIANIKFDHRKSKRVPERHLLLLYWLCQYLCVDHNKESSSSVQFSSVAQSCLTICYPMNHSMPGLPIHHQLLEFTQTHIHWVGDVI